MDPLGSPKQRFRSRGVHILEKPVLVSEREAREKSRDTEKDTETTSDKRRQQERLTDAVNWNAG